jgi:hypothetical protein
MRSNKNSSSRLGWTALTFKLTHVSSTMGLLPAVDGEYTIEIHTQNTVNMPGFQGRIA